MNKRLGKSQFDCADLDATYDCGCGDDPDASSPDTKPDTGFVDPALDLSKDEVTGVGLIKGGRR